MDEGALRSRAFGDPVYVSAHGITVREGALEFEDAHAQASLVIKDLGGPGKIDGTRGMTKARAKRLEKLGYVSICGEGSHDEGLTVTFRHAPRDEFDEGPRYVFQAQRAFDTSFKVWTMATQDGVDLVARHQPQT